MAGGGSLLMHARTIFGLTAHVCLFCYLLCGSYRHRVTETSFTRWGRHSSSPINLLPSTSTNTTTYERPTGFGFLLILSCPNSVCIFSLHNNYYHYMYMIYVQVGIVRVWLLLNICGAGARVEGVLFGGRIEADGRVGC